MERMNIKMAVTNKTMVSAAGIIILIGTTLYPDAPAL